MNKLMESIEKIIARADCAANASQLARGLTPPKRQSGKARAMV